MPPLFLCSFSLRNPSLHFPILTSPLLQSRFLETFPCITVAPPIFLQSHLSYDLLPASLGLHPFLQSYHLLGFLVFCSYCPLFLCGTNISPLLSSLSFSDPPTPILWGPGFFLGFLHLLRFCLPADVSTHFLDPSFLYFFNYLRFSSPWLGFHFLLDLSCPLPLFSQP